MTCRELSEFLGRYFAGELRPDERIVFEAHLAECPDCVAYVRTYAETMRLAKDACALDAMPAEVPEALVRAILATRETETSGSRPSSKHR